MGRDLEVRAIADRGHVCHSEAAAEESLTRYEYDRNLTLEARLQMMRRARTTSSKLNWEDSWARGVRQRW